MRRTIIFSFALLVVTTMHADIFSKFRTKEEIERKLSRLPAEGRRHTKAILYSALGTLLYREGKMVVAAQQFEKALQEAPTLPLKRHIYRYLGKSYESAGLADKAIKAYEASIQVDRRNWRRHRDVAHLYEETGLLQQASGAYRAALKLSPKEASVHHALGRTWRKLGLYGKAKASLEKGLGLGYDRVSVSQELSFVYEGQGRFGEAASSYRNTLTSTSSSEAWARVLYLAVLSRQAPLAQEALGFIKKDRQFYEALVEFGRTNSTDNSTLRALLNEITTSPL